MMTKDWNAEVNLTGALSQPAMPNMNAQPAMPNMYAQPAMPNMNAQPDYSQYQQPSVQPVVQAASPDPAMLPGNQAVMPQPAAPAGPTMYEVGSMRSDGNEWLEYPTSSGAWYIETQQLVNGSVGFEVGHYGGSRPLGLCSRWRCTSGGM